MDYHPRTRQLGNFWSPGYNGRPGGQYNVNWNNWNWGFLRQIAQQLSQNNQNDLWVHQVACVNRCRLAAQGAPAAAAYYIAGGNVVTFCTTNCNANPDYMVPW